MAASVKIYKDTAGHILWYIRADNGKILEISEEYLKSEPAPILSVELLPLRNQGAIKEDSSDGKTDTLLQFLKDLGGSAIVLAIPLYIAGWAHLRTYYSGFGLRVTELGFSLYDVLVYSIPVLVYRWWLTFIVFLLLLLIGMAFSSRTINRIPSPIRTAIFVIIFVLLIIGMSNWGAYIGAANATRDIMRDTTTLPNVAIEADPQKVKYNLEDFVEYNKLDYVLLLVKNEQYYLFVPLEPLNAQDIAPEVKNFEVSVIPASLINRIRIQRGVGAK